MQKLQKLIITERKELSPYCRLSEQAITRIALQCARDELAGAHIYIKQLKSELAIVPVWDGDTQDDIWRAIELYQAIISKIPQ